MSAYNPMMSKYLDFDPKLNLQNDKQNIKRSRDDMEAAIVKYHNVLGLPAFAGIPVVDFKLGVISIEDSSFLLNGSEVLLYSLKKD